MENYYYCKCCGCKFTETEGIEASKLKKNEMEIVCPNCEAFFNESEKYIERI